MNTLLATLFLGKSALLGSQLEFVYEPYEAASAPCNHALISASNPYDHEVICTDKKGVKHSFTAHIALSRYTHPTPPKASYELLYWVDHNGATTWFHFQKDAPLAGIESSQSITGENAGLRLRIKL